MWLAVLQITLCVLPVICGSVCPIREVARFPQRNTGDFVHESTRSHRLYMLPTVKLAVHTAKIVTKTETECKSDCQISHNIVLIYRFCLLDVKSVKQMEI